jgi:hypothetical protein
MRLMHSNPHGPPLSRRPPAKAIAAMTVRAYRERTRENIWHHMRNLCPATGEPLACQDFNNDENVVSNQFTNL